MISECGSGTVSCSAGSNAARGQRQVTARRQQDERDHAFGIGAEPAQEAQAAACAPKVMGTCLAPHGSIGLYSRLDLSPAHLSFGQSSAGS
jgi:hypothetical protein